MKLVALTEALVAVSIKAGRIARAMRAEKALFSLLVEEKTGGAKNKRFVQDFKTLGDVLVQEAVRHDISKQVVLRTLGSHSREESNTFTNTRGESVTVSIQPTEEETTTLLAKVLDGNTDAAKLLAEVVHSHVEVQKWPELETVTEELNDDIGVWIDPIDSTAQYISGHDGRAVGGIHVQGLQCVVVIIGVFHRSSGLPILGVCHQPFYTQDPATKRWSGRCIWGICHLGTQVHHVPDSLGSTGAVNSPGPRFAVPGSAVPGSAVQGRIYSPLDFNLTVPDNPPWVPCPPGSRWWEEPGSAYLNWWEVPGLTLPTWAVQGTRFSPPCFNMSVPGDPRWSVPGPPGPPWWAVPGPPDPTWWEVAGPPGRDWTVPGSAVTSSAGPDSAGPGSAGRRCVVVSSSERRGVQDQLARQYTVRHAAGAGYKLLCVVDRRAACYVLSGASTFKWDTCGPHAILRALGGDVVGFDGARARRRPPGTAAGDGAGESAVTADCRLRYAEPDPGERPEGEKWSNSTGLIAYMDYKDLVGVVQCLA